MSDSPRYFEKGKPIPADLLNRVIGGVSKRMIGGKGIKVSQVGNRIVVGSRKKQIVPLNRPYGGSVWKLKKTDGRVLWGADVTGQGATYFENENHVMRDIDIDDDGIIYVCGDQSNDWDTVNGSNASVWRLNQAGKIIWGWNTGGNAVSVQATSTGVFVYGARNNQWTGATGNASLWFLNKSGVFQWSLDLGAQTVTLGILGGELIQINNLKRISWDGSHLWVVNSNNLYKVNDSGSVVASKLAFTDGVPMGVMSNGTKVIVGLAVLHTTPTETEILYCYDPATLVTQFSIPASSGTGGWQDRLCPAAITSDRVFCIHSTRNIPSQTDFAHLLEKRNLIAGTVTEDWVIGTGAQLGSVEKRVAVDADGNVFFSAIENRTGYYNYDNDNDPAGFFALGDNLEGDGLWAYTTYGGGQAPAGFPIGAVKTSGVAVYGNYCYFTSLRCYPAARVGFEITT